MIELINVDKIYGKGDEAVHAVKNANVIIEDGKFTAILGKSGSGKSTLMNIIGAIDSPTNGKVIANGKDLTNMKPSELCDYRNETTGFIFQSFYLEPTLSVLDNVAMPLTIAGMKRQEREAKAMKILEALGMQDKAKKKASELSGGQKQRVSIARALVHDPSIVLADEPTGNLDSQNGAEVMKLLRNICDMGKSVVLVTHNMEDAANADNIIAIRDGELVDDDPVFNIKAIKEQARLTEASRSQAQGEVMQAAAVPTAIPTSIPTAAPTAVEAIVPTAAPTAAEAIVPTAAPTAAEAAIPTVAPTAVPTAAEESTLTKAYKHFAK